jgi:predicted kinase
VAADLAFLAMEYDESGFREEGHRLMEKIFELNGDPEAMTLLNFYKTYRALVRCKVNCILSGEPEIEDDAKKRSLVQAGRYLSLSMNYILAEGKPLILVVMGKTGTGKSTITAKLASHIGAEFVSTDFTRKKMFQLDPYTETPDSWKPRVYSAESSTAVYNELAKKAAEILTREKIVILDGTFGREHYRRLIRDQFSHARIFFIELDSDPSFIKNRLKSRDKTGDVSDARLNDKEKIDSLYEATTEIPSNKLISVMNIEVLDRVIEVIYKKAIERNIMAGTQNRQSRNQ